VYLPAIVDFVPDQMTKAIAAFLDFCYLARRTVHNEVSLDALDDALARFHTHRAIFEQSGVRPTGFLLPRQHSLIHYQHLIKAFGAPDGLCSSITESKHISAVKEPWRRSNRHEPLGQILLTTQRIDKLQACRIDFEARGMLSRPLLSESSDIMHAIFDSDARAVMDVDSADSASLSTNSLRDSVDHDTDIAAVEGPPVLANITLAQN